MMSYSREVVEICRLIHQRVNAHGFVGARAEQEVTTLLAGALFAIKATASGPLPAWTEGLFHVRSMIDVVNAIKGDQAA
jgi:hypothetical protein